MQSRTRTLALQPNRSMDGIAIVGMSGVFPDARNVDEFWRNLREGRNSITDAPRDRGWSIDDYFDPSPQTPGKTYTKRGAFLKEIDKFDPLFFEIPPHLAELMDPSARLFLQEAWKAIEDSGHSTSSFNGLRCGMYFCAKGDYSQVIQKHYDDTYLFSTDTYAPARLAYHLNLVGPVVSLDTACSSTLTAVAYACDALVLGNCDIAIVGGGGLNATPNAMITASQLLLLSPTGQCFAFDGRADGTVLGEAVGAIVLKPVERALRDGDHIYGLIRGWGINQDGRTNGPTAPSAKSQVRLQTDVYERFSIDPADITMVEAHGTGTKLGDVIEIQALTESFRHFTDRKGYCALGSLKSNIGHPFFGAGISSVIKVLQSIKHRAIPATLNFERIIPGIKIDDSPFFINTALKPWTAEAGRRRCAAINSFGATGTNAHVVIEEYIAIDAAHSVTVGQVPSPEAVPIVLSAKNRERLHAYARELLDFIENNSTDLDLTDLAYTLQVGRDAMAYRFASLARSLEELAQELSAFLSPAKAEPQESRFCEGGLSEGTVARLTVANGLRQQVSEALHHRDAAALIKLWIEGAQVDWLSLYSQEALACRRRVSLPGYPFAAERCWIPAKTKVEPREQVLARLGAQQEAAAERRGESKPKMLHPLLHTNVSDLDELCFTSSFTGEEFFLRDHRIQGEKVLPGVAYLELVRAAVSQLVDPPSGMSDFVTRLENVVWIQPFVHGPTNREIRIALDHGPNGEGQAGPQGPGRLEFEVYSGEPSDELVVRYCQGEACFKPRGERSVVDLSALRAGCSLGEMAPDELYSMLWAAGFMLGPGHQGISRLFIGKDQALGRLRLPAAASNGFVLHPALLDSALQTAVGLTGSSQTDSAGVSLPFALDALEVLSPCVDSMWAWVRYSRGGSSSDKVIRIDIDLCDDTGEVCVRMKGLTSRPLKSSLSDNSESERHRSDKTNAVVARTALLRKEWEARPIASRQQKAAGADHRRVICCGLAEFQRTIDLLEEELEPDSVTSIVIASDQDVAQAYTRAATTVFAVVQETLRSLATKKGDRRPVVIQLVLDAVAEQSGFRGLGAILKTANQESARFIPQTIVIGRNMTPDDVCDCSDREATTFESAEVRYDNGERQIMMLKEIDVPVEPAAIGHRQQTPWRESGTYLVTGGGGGLGLILARDFANSHSRGRLVLTGRSTLSDDKIRVIDALCAQGATIEYRQVDLCEQIAVQSLVDELHDAPAGLTGVIHCAGLVADNYLLNKSESELLRVFAPKVTGLVNLDQATKDMDLEFFVTFSSLAGQWGNAGQGDYAAANAFMDLFIERRRHQVANGSRHGRSLSIAWPLWREGGMKIDKAYEELMATRSGLLPLDTASGIAAFHAAFTLHDPVVLVMHGKPDMASKDNDKLAIKHYPSPSDLSADDTTDDDHFRANVVSELRRQVATLIGAAVERIDPHVELGQFGLDSILLTQLSNVLNRSLQIKLSPTVFFEYPTLHDLGGYLAAHQAEALQARLGAPSDPVTVTHQPVSVADGGNRATEATAKQEPKPDGDLKGPADKAAGATRHLSRARLRGRNRRAVSEATAEPASVVVQAMQAEPIAIIGMSCLFPMARNAREFWKNLLAGRDCITEIPKDRWDWQAIYGDPQERGGLTNIKWGGFIDNIGNFDPAFFSISPKEAERMDPQHRLLMTYVWKAIEDAGYAPSSFAGSDTALFMGTCDSGYYELFAEAGLKTNGAGMPSSMGPNRMSFFLDIHGPSEPVETACSSSLVAMHRAVAFLRTAQGGMAIAGGIQTIPTATKHVVFSEAGILSPDGRCKTFSDQADGYVRSEGVGIFVLKRLCDARRDGDHIHGVILGTAENHGGKANSVTSPNPKAQAQLLKTAYHDAGIDPRSVGYIEAHGTGTLLGDPIEINGLKTAFRELFQESPTGPTAAADGGCGLGSVKTNIGHTELAAGAAGVIKVLLQMKHRTLVKSLHCGQLNPHIDLDGSPFEIIREEREWNAKVDARGKLLPLRAGVSSFGVGGVNSHLVLEEHVNDPSIARARVADGRQHFILLSARDETVLAEQVRDLLEHVEDLRSNECALENIAYTLQVGREQMDVRLAIPAGSFEELSHGLKDFLGEKFDHPRYGRPRNVGVSQPGIDADFDQLIANYLKLGAYEKLVDLWLRGFVINWAALYEGAHLERVSLPSYPFKMDRYWITESRKERSVAPGSREAADGLPAAQWPSEPVAARFDQPKAERRTTPEPAGQASRVAPPAVHPASISRSEAGVAAPPSRQPAVVASGKPDLASQRKIQGELVSSLAAVLYTDANSLELDETFLELGVDSLIAVDWIRDVQRRYGLTIKVAAIYDYPTLRSFSEFLVQRLANEGKPAVSSAPAENEPSAHHPDAQITATTPVYEAPKKPSDLHDERSLPRAAGLERTNQIFRVLANELAAMLSVRPSDISTDQFVEELSLDAARMQRLLAVINERAGTTLTIKDMTGHSTLRDLIECIGDHMAGASGAPAAKTARSAANDREGRLQAQTAPDGAHASTEVPDGYGLVVSGANSVDEVRWLPWHVELPRPLDVTIEVKASAINFADVMCITGIYPTMPDYPFSVGFEVAGIVSAVGSLVTSVSVGDEVVALAGDNMGGHASHVNVPANNVVLKPSNTTFEEACSLPVAFLTVYSAFEAGRLAPNDQVLIHAATGGCGLMAIQLANLKQCACIASSSKEYKRELLTSIGVSHVVDYQKDFDREVLDLTGGRGVDVVLNTVSGAAIQRGLNSLAPSGRYVELAVHALKVGPKLNLSRLVDNQSFHSIDVRRLSLREANGASAASTLDIMRSMVEANEIVPIVTKIFPKEQIGEAMRCVSRGEHVGKIVVSHTARAVVDCQDECMDRLRRQKRVQPVGRPSDGRDRLVAALAERPSHDVVRGKAEPMAVIGMSGQFPLSSTLTAYWDNIATGRDCVTSAPQERWGLNSGQSYGPDEALYPFMGTLQDAEMFDPLFFNLSPKEARLMDPQQRVFLQNCWSCIEDAGVAPSSLAGTRCGVFVGCSATEYAMLDNTEVSTHALMGNTPSILPGRISYLLDLRGPCLVIDTACSSSLVAISEACTSLSAGNCDMALAGGVSVLPSARFSAMAEEGGMLSVDGRCFTFDERANGFVPAEGVGVLFLKRLVDAVRDNDQIHGVIVGWGVNHDGKTNGITAPSAMSQAALECEVYERFAIDPASISYVEAHGTGTKLGDPIEVEGLTKSFRSFTDKVQYCALGSVKSNIGHALGAAGVAGVLKVLLSIKHQKIPPAANFNALNSEIDIHESPFYINTELKDWTTDGDRRRATVSSFSYSGTNAHIVLEEYPRDVSATRDPSWDDYLIVLSARGQEQLVQHAHQLLQHVEENSERSDALLQVAYTLQTGRDSMVERMGFVTDSIADMKRRLLSFINRESPGPSTWQHANVREAKRTLDRATEDIASRQAAAIKEAIERRDHAALLEHWLAGSKISWQDLYAEMSVQPTSLPTYPFAKKPYWLTPPSKAAGHDGKTQPAGSNGHDLKAADAVVAQDYRQQFEQLLTVRAGK